MIKDIHLCDMSYCTGCMACKQKCNSKAIETEIVNGFAYPVIDTDKCKRCGLCMSVCPVLKEKNETEFAYNETVCYAVWAKNDATRKNSSSGGVFSILAESILNDGGVVFGAAWNENMKLVHKGIESSQDLEILRRSKYVQSNIANTYIEARSCLKAGRKVMFCGTPCQIEGLVSFLGNIDNSNLLTVGVVCQGVPSQWSFDKYISEISAKEQIKVYDCNFRSKDRGWRCGLLNLLIYGKNSRGKDVVINKVAAGNSYYNAFLKHYFLRESCYNCPFKGETYKCHADIMLSDFWSGWSVLSYGEVDYSKGISAVAAYTDKGRSCLKLCSDALVIKERPYSDYASNSGLRCARKPNNNDQALEYLKSNSWMDVQSKFFPMTLPNKMSIYARLLLGDNIFFLLKKIIKIRGK